MTARDYKEIGLTTGALLLGALLFFSLATWAEALPDNFWVLGPIVALAALWLMVISLALGLVRSKYSAAALIIIPPLVVVVAGMFNIGAFGGGFLLLLALTAARQSLTQEMVNKISFRAFRVFRSGMYWVVVGIIVAIAGIMLSRVEQAISSDRVMMNATQVAAVLGWMQPVVAQVSPGLDVNQNIDAMIDEQIKKELGPNVTITAGQRALARQQLESQLGTQLSGQETLADITAQRINGMIKQVTRINSLMVALVIIILVLLTIRAFIPVIVWPLAGLMSVLVWLCNKSGLTKLNVVPVEAERLEID